MARSIRGFATTFAVVLTLASAASVGGTAVVTWKRVK